MLQEDFLLPVQSEPVNPHKSERYRRLWAAVLEDAIALAWKPHQAKLHQRACLWIAETGCEVGSFEWVCEMLKLDAESVRRRILCE